MKFGSHKPARPRVAEAGQRYRGMTFTERGELLLDVGSVQDGRVELSQRGQSMRLLPETLSSIHHAWQDGDIPLGGKENWECSTFSPDASNVDEVRCICRSKDQLLIADKISQNSILVTRGQIKLVVEHIVDPWLAGLGPSKPAAALAQSVGQGPRRNLDSPTPVPENPSPPFELT